MRRNDKFAESDVMYSSVFLLIYFNKTTISVCGFVKTVAVAENGTRGYAKYLMQKCETSKTKTIFKRETIYMQCPVFLRVPGPSRFGLCKSDRFCLPYF